MANSLRYSRGLAAHRAAVSSSSSEAFSGLGFMIAGGMDGRVACRPDEKLETFLVNLKLIRVVIRTELSRDALIVWYFEYSVTELRCAI